MKWNSTALSRVDPTAEPEGEIFDPEKFDAHASLKLLAKDGMDVLQRKYPGWQWGLQINVRGRMVNVFNLTLHDTWGYTIRASEVEHDPTRHQFLVAGGEILERFGFPRGGIDWNRVAMMKRDARGRGIPILNDLEHAAARKELRKRKLDEALRLGHYMLVDGRVVVGVGG